MLFFVLLMQFVIFTMLLVLIFSVAPIVPDILDVVHTVDVTLTDVRIMLPEMNGTLWDMNHLMPGIRETIRYTRSICEHTSGCMGYK